VVASTDSIGSRRCNAAAIHVRGSSSQCRGRLVDGAEETGVVARDVDLDRFVKRRLRTPRRRRFAPLSDSEGLAAFDGEIGRRQGRRGRVRRNMLRRRSMRSGGERQRAR
jgi:hypothetical protein